MPPVHVHILARAPLIAEELRAALDDRPGLDVHALAPAGAQLDDLLDDFFDELPGDAPGVALVDVELLETLGWRLLQDFGRSAPQLVVIVVADQQRDSRVAQALRLGARGFVQRASAPDQLAQAIRAAHSGSVVLDSSAARSLLDATVRPADPDDADEEIARNRDLVEPLSEREFDVLRLMARGMANKQIAAELIITEHTVKFHIRSILGKLGAANRTEAVTLALQKGLVSL
jgi:DNA-binding NarL/FixJ family response regulator